MASQQTIEIVKATVPVLSEHGETITEVFYKLLFENHPELKDVFNMTHQQKGTQPKVLANAIFQYAVHIDKLHLLGDAVESIAQKHTSLSIPAASYPIVGKYLLLAIKEVLGEAATPEIIDAWAEAYGDLAAIFVQREETIYSEREKSVGGFRGTKEFTVAKVVQESSVIKSFYLKRKDGSPAPQFTPGQYIAITVTIPNTEHKHTRNYSLSDSPNQEYLRISIKKEAGNPNGMVSNYLHDTLNEGSEVSLGMPSGEFVWKPSKKPMVLISGGIGVTPLLSMFKTAMSKKEQECTFIQCVLNSDTQAFREEVKVLEGSNAKTYSVYSAPLAKDILGENHDYIGFLSQDILENIGITKDSDFYFCGPTSFMANTIKILENMGIQENQIHYEFFGPKEELAMA